VTNGLCYALVVEKLLNIDVPDGTSALRSKRIKQFVKPVTNCSYLLAKYCQIDRLGDARSVARTYLCTIA
jgi:hypothetical protein